MSIVVLILLLILCIVLCMAFLDYMGFLRIPEVKAGYIQENNYIVFSFQGSLADLTRCTEYALIQISKSLGRPYYFPKIMCCYHNIDAENAALSAVRISLLFPINDINGLSEKIASTPSHNLQLFHLPSLRVASSSFPYRNALSYTLGQIRIYPFIIRFAKQNGITDTSVVVETYETDKSILYSLVLEKTELFNPFQSMPTIDARSF